MHPARPKPLSHVRVLDLSRLLPGPMATLHLADLGADLWPRKARRIGEYDRAVLAVSSRLG